MNLAVRSCAMRALLALPLVTVPTSALASGFAIESQGARAMGFAGAYVAQAADPSAQNPAVNSTPHTRGGVSRAPTVPSTVLP